MIRFMKKVDRFQYISFITFKFNIAIGLKYLLDFDLFIPNVSCGNMKIQSSKEKKKKKKFQKPLVFSHTQLNSLFGPL